MRRRGRFGLAAFVLAAAAACSSSSSPTAPPGPSSTGPSTGQGTVGASGGQVATTDGALTVTVPAGALPADTTITINEITAPASGAIGKTYDIGPSGTQFTAPVTLSFKYGADDLQGSAPSDLEVATIVNGAWVALTANAVDTSSQVASGQTMHLSPYGIHSKKQASVEGDGGGNDGATGNSDAASDGGADAGFDAAGCHQMASQVGSCANHPQQVCQQGLVFTNCVNLQPQGMTWECCQPSF
jgi:hypothetical protein